LALFSTLACLDESCDLPTLCREDIVLPLLAAARLFFSEGDAGEVTLLLDFALASFVTPSLDENSAGCSTSWPDLVRLRVTGLSLLERAADLAPGDPVKFS